MESALYIRQVYQSIQPDCVAVELPETLQLQLLHAASRLPDIAVVIALAADSHPLYLLAEPCDPGFEALRSALNDQIAAFCIDLDVQNYPQHKDPLPDPYSIHKIGMQSYYTAYKEAVQQQKTCQQDQHRELYMAKRLKELSLCYDKILFVAGLDHVESVLKLTDQTQFPTPSVPCYESIQLCTLTDQSQREVLSEYGWISVHYEQARTAASPLDRQKLILQLYKAAICPYTEQYHTEFASYHIKNIMKFARNFAFVQGRLVPNLYQLLSAAKGCVEHNFAYYVWEKATDYPFRKNIDNLPELNLSPEDLWGSSKIIHFHRKLPREKGLYTKRKKKDQSRYRFEPPSQFSICSYPPEDVIVEKFGHFLQKKGVHLLQEQEANTQPFTTSLEDGIDTKETIRHWATKQLYVKVQGRPPSGVGSVVVIFDSDEEQKRYPWQTTWLGEHEQESDMALYATRMGENVVGPGICRCKYGAMMMSYPPRRMLDVWSDPDYSALQSRADVLLAAAIDYAIQPVVVYVAAKPPKPLLKSFASRYGKKIAYIPIGQLSKKTLNKIQTFHVLDNHNRRQGADEYIL